MKVFPAQKLSIYNLALLSVQPSPLSLSLTPANLLSLLRSQIDLLIEQEIAATLWVKLPPGQIWHSEIQRYRQKFGDAVTICTFEVAQTPKKQENRDFSSSSSLCKHNSRLFYSSLEVQFPGNYQLQREYFLIVLSPKFSSLIVACRTGKSQKTLMGINTIDGKVIQQVLSGMQKAIPAESLAKVPFDFVSPTVLETTLIDKLLAKQTLRQEEIYHEIIRKRIARVEQQKQKLYKSLQLKDEFLDTACQELRIPLTHMKTALSLLNSPNLKNSQRQRYLQMLNAECDRQTSLINGVLELIQIERNFKQTTLELVRLSDIVPGVVSTYQPLAQEKGIMLAYTVSAELPPVWCVPGGLRQIVIHLLSNSIKFTPCGGQVWVRGRARGDRVFLEFRDTGIGISENDIAKIFDRFYRVRPAASEDRGGSGLGLTIVRQLLESCGGSISVKSKPSEGSTFTVQLVSASNKTHQN